MMWKTSFSKCIIIILQVAVAPVLFAQEIRDINIANAYFKNGDVEKARELYEEMLKDERNIPFIHNNYLELLQNQAEHKEAEKYVKKVITLYPDNINYRVDYIVLLTETENQKEADKQYLELSLRIAANRNLVRTAAQQFLNKQKNSYAEQIYLNARKATGISEAYALELASLYRYMGEKEKAVMEYIQFLQSSPANARYVKNMLQNILNKEEDLQMLESVLLEKIQKTPTDTALADLLIWNYTQMKNFYAAFMQARAIDRRIKNDGDLSLEIGSIALENKDFENSIRIFEYIAKTFPGTPNYVKAKSSLVYAKGKLYTSTFPIDTLGIRSLILDYKNLIEEIGMNTTTLESKKEKANLHAFYLNEKEQAIALLQEVIEHPLSNKKLVAESKLELGDIYILTGAYWESALLYAQVDRENKNELIGYKAKLQNAKLSYYKGDFDLATGRLDILKLATDREIANDAIQLSTMIKKNIAYDTTREALKEFAAIELMLYQNQKSEAMHQLDLMNVKYQVQQHQILDDILWLQAKINNENGFFEQALLLYDKIHDEFPESIYADDAFFMKALVYETGLKDKQKAMETYQQFLKNYPGSFFAADARLRFRKLRGDYN